MSEADEVAKAIWNELPLRTRVDLVFERVSGYEIAKERILAPETFTVLNSSGSALDRIASGLRGDAEKLIMQVKRGEA